MEHPPAPTRSADGSVRCFLRRNTTGRHAGAAQHADRADAVWRRAGQNKTSFGALPRRRGQHVSALGGWLSCHAQAGNDQV